MKYTLQHTFDIITENTTEVKTSCNGISFENTGNVPARLFVGNIYQVLPPGAIRSFGQVPEVMLVTKFSVEFDEQGIVPPDTRIDVTRELITTA